MIARIQCLSDRWMRCQSKKSQHTQFLIGQDCIEFYFSRDHYKDGVCIKLMVKLYEKNIDQETKEYTTVT